MINLAQIIDEFYFKLNKASSTELKIFYIFSSKFKFYAVWALAKKVNYICQAQVFKNNK